jgi:26-hydroxylase
LIKTLTTEPESGPYGIPILGYLPFMGSDPHKQYGKLGKKYGRIFSVTFGSLP